MQHEWGKYFDTESDYWEKIQEIYKENDNYPKVVVKDRNLHHKFPRSFSKKDGTAIDNDKDNLVSLPLASHFLVHYYLWKCAKTGYRQLMALAFQYMRKKSIKYADDTTIEALAIDYAYIMNDVSTIHSIVGKSVIEKYGSPNQRMTYDERSAASKKGKETIKKHFTPEEWKKLNYEKMSNVRGKSYIEIYGEDKAEEQKTKRANSRKKYYKKLYEKIESIVNVLGLEGDKAFEYIYYIYRYYKKDKDVIKRLEQMLEEMYQINEESDLHV